MILSFILEIYNQVAYNSKTKANSSVSASVKDTYCDYLMINYNSKHLYISKTLTCRET